MLKQVEETGKAAMPSVQVMKRGRTEQIQYAVTQYLKRRQYVDTEGSLKGAKLSQSAEEMAASLTGTLTEHFSSGGFDRLMSEFDHFLSRV